MSFDALLSDLETFQKAMPPQFESDGDGDADDAPPPKAKAKADPGDKKIAAAADGDKDGDGTPDGEDDLPEDDEEEEGDETFGKAFKVTTATGDVVEAYDGTAMMKAFEQRLAAMEQTHITTESNLQKAEAVIGKQSEMIKSLHGQLASIQEQGRGRKSALTIHDKPASVPTAPDRPAPHAVLAKAMSAQQTGKITGQDVARIESYLSRGLAVPSELADLIN